MEYQVGGYCALQESDSLVQVEKWTGGEVFKR